MHGSVREVTSAMKAWVIDGEERWTVDLEDFASFGPISVATMEKTLAETGHLWCGSRLYLSLETVRKMAEVIE